MILKIFAIRDNKAEAFNTPFFTPTKGLAIRSFQEAVNDKNTPFSKYPDDFTMFELGSFDDNTGELTMLSPILAVSNALELVTEAPA